MKDLAEIKESLLARKGELEQALALIYKEKVTDDQVQDSADQALASTLEGIKLTLHDREHDEYQRILKALEMIDKGTYGVCSDCGQSISERRLTMFPNATRCLVCQEAFEESPLAQHHHR